MVSTQQCLSALHTASMSCSLPYCSALLGVGNTQMHSAIQCGQSYLTMRQHFTGQGHFHIQYLIQSSEVPCEAGSVFPISHEEGLVLKPQSSPKLHLIPQTFLPHPPVQATPHSLPVSPDPTTSVSPGSVFPLRGHGSKSCGLFPGGGGLDRLLSPQRRTSGFWRTGTAGLPTYLGHSSAPSH